MYPSSPLTKCTKHDPRHHGINKHEDHPRSTPDERHCVYSWSSSSSPRNGRAPILPQTRHAQAPNVQLDMTSATASLQSRTLLEVCLLYLTRDHDSDTVGSPPREAWPWMTVSPWHLRNPNRGGVFFTGPLHHQGSSRPRAPSPQHQHSDVSSLRHLQTKTCPTRGGLHEALHSA